MPPPSSSPHYRVVPGRLAPLPRTATSQCRTAAMPCAAISLDRARAAASLQGVVHGAFVHHLLLHCVRKLLVRETTTSSSNPGFFFNPHERVMFLRI